MFRSQVRPLIIPQYEHGRLAGTFAQHWGNEDFDRPALDFSSFVQGVALHDWHYGFGDNLPIMGANEADWLAMTRQGMTLRLDDPTSDIVAKLHLRRLLSFQRSPERSAMATEIETYVNTRLPETGHLLGEFEWADKITGFCDFVSFHFCFEEPCERTMMVGSRVESSAETAVTYQIRAGGQITINPWPFALPYLSGSILGFMAEGYPDTLRPLFVPFQVTPAKSKPEI